MTDGFRVDPDAVLRYAVTAEQHQGDLPRAASAIAHVNIPHGAFGKLPGSEELHSAYREYAGAAEQNIKALADIVGDVAGGLRSVAGNYLHNEQALSQGLDDVLWAL
jgi:hypothetical protein